MPFTLRPYRRFTVQSLVTIAILCVVHTPVHAELCMPPVVQKDSPYQYILTLVDAMSYAKSALAHMPKNMNSQSSEYDLLLGLKLGKADFECAASQVSPYAASSTETIQSACGGSLGLCASRGSPGKVSLPVHSDSQFDRRARDRAGTVLEKQAELGAAYDETWKLLAPAAAAATYSVVEEDPTTGRMSGLALIAKQRDDILQTLRSTFGEEITRGIKAGQISLMAAAAVLYEVIGNQSRKTRDSK